MATPAGYSGKPVFQKLGIKDDTRIHPLCAPAAYDEIVPGHPGRLVSGTADLVHLFCADRATLNTRLPDALGFVEQGGMLWVSWPKKSSALFVDLTEDDLRSALLPLGWVDVKVCAVSDQWSGLKFLKRKR